MSNSWSQNITRARRYAQLKQTWRRQLLNSLVLTLQADCQRSGLAEQALIHCEETLAIGPDVTLRSALEAEARILQSWCEQHGYTDLFFEAGSYWAFPRNGVMPVKVREAMKQMP